ncbi:MAG: transglutaminase family protein [Acidimicrobiales bacterium]
MTTESFLERVRRANIPPPPDDSILFRIATTVAVVAGLAAAESVGELSPSLAVAATAAVGIGMLFSYATRNHPWQWLKVFLAVAVVCVFGVFVNQILNAAHTGQLASIELPLAGLFTWVQAVHAFDVPARRDLLFSLAAGTALITIAAAQAVSGNFVIFAAVWLVATVLGLTCSWHSMTGDAARPSIPLLAGCLLGVVALALALLAVLPQPRAAQGLTLPASLTSYLPLTGTGLVNGTGAHPAEPAVPGRPGGRIGVGGYIGFGGQLNTADRARLGNQVVMRVRADRPGYFLGLTYNTWNGQSWLQSRNEKGSTELTGGSPFQLPPTATAGGPVTTNVQTFYVEQPLPNLLFATSSPAQVYFPSHTLVLGHDGSIRTPVGITPGTVYTVVSEDAEVTPTVLARDRAQLTPALRRSAAIRSALQLPHPYPRVEALARSIVKRSHARSTEAVIQSLETWIGAHTRYSTAIPPLRRGQDAVDEFLFGNRRGYCEQISTALAVMLRTLGIPAREAIGYVPGPLNPLSGLYTNQAKDAHAWVQVYFPHYGWQNFDPTAQVPLATQNPGTVLLHDLWTRVAHLPWAPIGGLAVGGTAGYGARYWDRRRRSRPAGWAGRVSVRLERTGTRMGCRRSPAETLSEYANRLGGEVGVSLKVIASAVECSAYGCDPGAAAVAGGSSPDRSGAEQALKQLVTRSRRLRFKRVAGEPPRKASVR